uniref:Uncharacterized protein n=1 Tax=Globodera rostochiensis TaxID=31243 RepID=A0A914IDY8_GLORO
MELVLVGVDAFLLVVTAPGRSIYTDDRVYSVLLNDRWNKDRGMKTDRWGKGGEQDEAMIVLDPQMQRMCFPRVEMETEDPGTPTLGFALRSSYSTVLARLRIWNEQLVHHSRWMTWEVGEEHPGVIPVQRGRC